MLTVDRFLTVYLNLRYLLVWNVKKTKWVLKFCFLSAFVANAFFLIYFNTYEQALRYLAVFVWFPVDNLFIFIVTITYIYILVRVLRRKTKIQKSVSPSLPSTSSFLEKTSDETTTDIKQENQDTKRKPSVCNTTTEHESISRSPSYTWKTFTVPFLLIATFIVFIGFPDNTYFSYFILGKTMPAEMSVVFFSFYPTGILCDAVIYILCQRDVRKYLFNKLSCNCNRGSTGSYRII